VLKAAQHIHTDLAINLPQTPLPLLIQHYPFNLVSSISCIFLYSCHFLYSLAVSCLCQGLCSPIVHNPSLALHNVMTPFLSREFEEPQLQFLVNVYIPVNCRSEILITMVTPVTKVFMYIALQVKHFFIFCSIFTEIEYVDKLL